MQSHIITEENKMKLRFDTYTKSCGLAIAAFDELASLTDNLTLTVSNWNGSAYNLHGEVKAENVAKLNELCDNDNWNEDASEL